MSDTATTMRRGAAAILWAYGAAFLTCAALAWLVRDAPVQLGAFGGLVRVDALGAFFALLAVAGCALLTWRGGNALRVALAGVVLLASYCTTHLLLLVGSLLLATLLLMRPPRRSGWSLATLLAPCFLLLGVGVLWLGSGAWRYDAPAIGAALSSVVFWCVLVAAVAGGAALLRDLNPLATVWLYPLLRLYSLGPWNTGWSFATLLLGGAAALWCAAEATRAAEPEARTRWVVAAYAGAALAGAGLSSAAGVGACCYTLFCVPLLVFGLAYERQETGKHQDTQLADDAEMQGGDPQHGANVRVHPRSSPPIKLWFTLRLAALSGALPITAPFVALWLGVGAAVAGGVPLLSVALWLAGLGAAFATLRAIRTSPTQEATRRDVIASALSFALGVAAPAVVAWPIMPVGRQLGGGLTPYGDLAIWPWVGLAALDAARQPVASLPSAALAGLMVVLASLAWLFVLLRGARRQ